MSSQNTGSPTSIGKTSERGEYPEDLETYRTTRTGLEILLRPVKISDEPLLKDFFYSLSDQSLYRRFFSIRKRVPHELLQDFVIIDYTTRMVILAVIKEEKEEVVGIGQYGIQEDAHTAIVAFVVRDDYQNKGIGAQLLSYLTYLAKKQGLLKFYAEVFFENEPMLHLFEKMGYPLKKKRGIGVYELEISLT